MALSALIGIAVLFTAALSTWRSGADERAGDKPPSRLSGLRVVGHDDAGRPFELTAVSATRQPEHAHRITLERPVLVMERGRDARTRVTAATGLYDEQTGSLALSGGVDYSGARGVYKTNGALVDTRKGEVTGSSAVQAETPLGQVEGESYQVTKSGENVVVKGGVRGRIAPN